VTPSSFPGRESIYQLNTIAQNWRNQELTPAGQELVTGTGSLGGGKPYEAGNLSQNEWPLVREGQYPRLPDGTILIEHPWSNFSFFGPNRIDIFVIDNNLLDLIESDDAQQQGGGTPGEIPNVVDHVENGTGVFGGLAKVTRSVVVTKP
jgi:hypothetical protein